MPDEPRATYTPAPLEHSPPAPSVVFHVLDDGDAVRLGAPRSASQPSLILILLVICMSIGAGALRHTASIWDFAIVALALAVFATSVVTVMGRQLRASRGPDLLRWDKHAETLAAPQLGLCFPRASVRALWMFEVCKKLLNSETLHRWELVLELNADAATPSPERWILVHSSFSSDFALLRFPLARHIDIPLHSSRIDLEPECEAPSDTCRTCGYSLIGLESSAKCPECGRHPQAAR